MEFNFNVNDIFKGPIVKIDQNLLPPGFKGDRRQLWETINKVSEVVNAMGEASAAAQGLTKSITTADRLRNSEQNVYLLIDEKAHNGKGAITGMLKTGKKGLYVFDRNGQHYQVSPPCVLDFYVHESKQRQGLGKELFEHMLQQEKVEPVKMAIDRPSDKLLGFLNKHYGLRSPVKQMNNFVVFDDFFPKQETNKEENDNDRVITSRTRGANGLQTSTQTSNSPYGRYGAPRPPCSMGQIIHNQSSVLSRGNESLGQVNVQTTVSAPAVVSGQYNQNMQPSQKILKHADPDFCEYPPRKKTEQNVTAQNYKGGMGDINDYQYQQYNNQQIPSANIINQVPQMNCNNLPHNYYQIQNPVNYHQYSQPEEKYPNFHQQISSDSQQLMNDSNNQQKQPVYSVQTPKNQIDLQQTNQYNNQNPQTLQNYVPPIHKIDYLQPLNQSLIPPDQQFYEQTHIPPQGNIVNFNQNVTHPPTTVSQYYENINPYVTSNENQVTQNQILTEQNSAAMPMLNSYYSQPNMNGQQVILNNLNGLQQEEPIIVNANPEVAPKSYGLQNVVHQPAGTVNSDEEKNSLTIEKKMDGLQSKITESEKKLIPSPFAYAPKQAFGLQETENSLHKYITTPVTPAPHVNAKFSGLQNVQSMDQIYQTQHIPQRNVFTIHEPQRTTYHVSSQEQKQQFKQNEPQKIFQEQQVSQQNQANFQDTALQNQQTQQLQQEMNAQQHLHQQQQLNAQQQKQFLQDQQALLQQKLKQQDQQQPAIRQQQAVLEAQKMQDIHQQQAILQEQQNHVDQQRQAMLNQQQTTQEQEIIQEQQNQTTMQEQQKEVQQQQSILQDQKTQSVQNQQAIFKEQQKQALLHQQAFQQNLSNFQEKQKEADQKIVHQQQSNLQEQQKQTMLHQQQAIQQQQQSQVAYTRQNVQNQQPTEDEKKNLKHIQNQHQGTQQEQNNIQSIQHQKAIQQQLNHETTQQQLQQQQALQQQQQAALQQQQLNIQNQNAVPLQQQQLLQQQALQQQQLHQQKELQQQQQTALQQQQQLNNQNQNAVPQQQQLHQQQTLQQQQQTALQQQMQLNNQNQNAVALQQQQLHQQQALQQQQAALQLQMQNQNTVPLQQQLHQQQALQQQAALQLQMQNQNTVPLQQQLHQQQALQQQAALQLQMKNQNAVPLQQQQQLHQQHALRQHAALQLQMQNQNAAPPPQQQQQSNLNQSYHQSQPLQNYHPQQIIPSNHHSQQIHQPVQLDNLMNQNVLQQVQSSPQTNAHQRPFTSHQKVTLQGQPETAFKTQSVPEISQRNDLIHSQPVPLYQNQRNSLKTTAPSQTALRNGLDVDVKKSAGRVSKSRAAVSVNNESQRQFTVNQQLSGFPNPLQQQISSVPQTNLQQISNNQQYIPVSQPATAQMSQPLSTIPENRTAGPIPRIIPEKLGRHEFIPVTVKSIFSEVEENPDQGGKPKLERPSSLSLANSEDHDEDDGNSATMNGGVQNDADDENKKDEESVENDSHTGVNQRNDIKLNESMVDENISPNESGRKTPGLTAQGYTAL